MCDSAAPCVVIGIGNRFRRDDAVGPKVVDALERDLPGVTLVESDGDPVDLMTAWQGATTAIIVDAVVSGGKPGTIYRFNGGHRLPATFFRRSSHLLGLAEAVELARTLDKLPERLVVVGVEAGEVAYGQELSSDVEGAVPRVVGLVQRLLVEAPSAEEGEVGVGHA